MKWVFYGLLLPLSWLPKGCLMGLSSLVAWVLCDILVYRKTVILDNLKRSLPQLTADEREQLRRRYYRHLSDLLFETVYSFRFSREKALSLYACDNPEILNRHAEANQSVILVSAHYHNWEWMVLTLDQHFKHHGIGVGKAISNVWLDHKINAYRQRFGTEVVFASNVRQTFDHYLSQNKPCAYMLLFDQSPNDVSRCYWATFLHQDTGFIYGPEYFAKKYEFPVYYYHVYKEAWGKYRFCLKPIELEPNSSPYGQIMQHCLAELEADIQKNPLPWLWSHRRWKHQRPNSEVPS